MSSGADGSSVLIVGDGQTAALCSHALINQGRGRFRLAGVVPPSQMQDFLRQEAGWTGQGPLKSPGRVVVAVDDRRGRLPLAELVTLRFAGVKVQDASSFLEDMGRKVPVRSVLPSDLVFSDGFRSSRRAFWSKSITEWFLALFLLALAAPCIVLAVVVILLESGWPVFFRQDRVGLHGKVFKVIKLRTMFQDAEKTGPQFALANDKRITRFGRLLRRSRFDELPQLINVLRGEMAVVGPRPERPAFVEGFKELIPYFAYRHSVRPGITGWAQVMYGYTDDTNGSLEKLSYDLYYIKHCSLQLDLKILLGTIKTVIQREGR